MDSVTIIIPVYGDWESLENNIETLRFATSKTNHHVLYVNDCGPEADMIERNIIEKIKDWKNADYFRNDSNLGFVRTCNRAVFDLAGPTVGDILLLNSDTFVTPDFLDGMIHTIESDNRIASVSPRSNNATVFSIPFNAATEKYLPEHSFLIFDLIKNHIPEYYESPTTHGFCMLIRKKVIDEIGLFDEIYGRGYGEENDFCMRASASGYKHAIANKSFVFHEGSKSFAPEGREKQIEKNAKILLERYPTYSDSVDQYITNIVIPEQTQITTILQASLPQGASLSGFIH